MRNSGILMQMPDGRKCVVYKKQPLLQEKGKIIIHLLDEDLKPFNDENGKPKMLIKDVSVYNEEAQANTIIGYID